MTRLIHTTQPETKPYSHGASAARMVSIERPRRFPPTQGGGFSARWTPEPTALVGRGLRCRHGTARRSLAGMLFSAELCAAARLADQRPDALR
jgi:hypothetical protein